MLKINLLKSLNYSNLHFVFFFIWIFFFIRLYKNINFEDLQSNFFSFNILLNYFSVLILIFMICYNIYNIIKIKKISIYYIILIYPFSCLIAYFKNEINLNYDFFFTLHHFITLTSVILFFSILDLKKEFDEKFIKNLFIISSIILFTYFLISILPEIFYKIKNNLDLRLSLSKVVTLDNTKITKFSQNVNGQGRICIILYMICLFFFMKYNTKKILLSSLFFFVALILISIIFLFQSRFNIGFSYLFSLFLVLKTQNLSKFKKFVFMLLIVMIPYIIFKNISNKETRFFDNYSTPEYSLNKNKTSFVLYNENKEVVLQNYTRLKPKNLDINNISEDFTLTNDYQKNILFFKAFLLSKKEMEKNIHLFQNKNNYNNLIENLYIFKEYILLDCPNYLKKIDSLLTGRICGWIILYKDFKINNLFGNGFFSDQFFLNFLEKTSSNSWINIMYNGGVLSLISYFFFIFFILFKFFKYKNSNEDFLISSAYFLIGYFLLRFILEDTLAFVNIDFLMFFLLITFIKKNYKNYIKFT